MLESRAYNYSAHTTAGFVLLPGRSGNIASYHALDRDHLRAHHHRRPPVQLVGILLRRWGISFHIVRDHMVGHEVAEEIEPEEGNLGQYASLMWNASGQHIVESRDAIGGNEEKMLTVEIVHIPDLTAGVQFQFREVGAKQNGVEKLGI